MTNQTTPTYRAGQVGIAQEEASEYSLIALVENRPGSIDRVVGLLRRRRANMQTLVLGRSETPDVARITVTMNDSEVGVDQLVEQLRKVVDVRHVESLASAQSVARELALVKITSTPANFNDIIELGQLFGAHAVDVTADTVTLEVTGNEAKVEEFVKRVEPYGIREVARSGCVTIARGAADM